jgi:glycosyltransferase involved in cell wall biosynthesis
VKILFVIRSLGVGGAEHQLVTLAKGLRQAGHEPAVAVFYPGGAFESELRDAGIALHSLEKRGRWDFAFVARLVEVTRRFKPDIVHSYLATSNKVAAALRPLLGGANVVWGVRSAFMDLSRYDWLTRLSYRVEPWLSPLADAVILNSRAAAEHARRAGFRGSRLVVVPNGIDCGRFRQDMEGRATWRRRWGAGARDFVFGVVGRLDPMKDHSTFLRAAGVVASREPRVTFVCVGDGPEKYRLELQELAGRLGLGARIRWERATRDVASVYSALDILVLSSYGESFPNVLAEAMACSTPCIASDVGDAAAIVANEGPVVPPRDADRLAAAMQEALSWSDEERRRRGAAARARIEAHFSVPAMVRNTIAVLDSVRRSRQSAQ